MYYWFSNWFYPVHRQHSPLLSDYVHRQTRTLSEAFGQADVNTEKNRFLATIHLNDTTTITQKQTPKVGLSWPKWLQFLLPPLPLFYFYFHFNFLLVMLWNMKGKRLKRKKCKQYFKYRLIKKRHSIFFFLSSNIIPFVTSFLVAFFYCLPFFCLFSFSFLMKTNKICNFFNYSIWQLRKCIHV